jgi:hypothetical protein
MRVEKSGTVEATETTSLDEGRELDALIAERVMGYRWCVWPNVESRFLDLHWDKERAGSTPLPATGDEPTSHYALSTVPCYSTDIAAAWQVVEKIAARNGDTVVSVTHNSRDGERIGGEEKYFCTIEDISDGIEEWEAEGVTAPLAICRAALKAVADKEVVSARSAPSTNPPSARATEGESK